MMCFCHLLLFSDHCAILESGYLKSEKITNPELVRSQTNNLLLYMLHPICEIAHFMNYSCPFHELGDSLFIFCPLHELTILMSLTVTGFYCANSDLGLREQSFFFIFICCVVYLLVSSHRRIVCLSSIISSNVWHVVA
jgi:hypothetical protein